MGYYALCYYASILSTCILTCLAHGRKAEKVTSVKTAPEKQVLVAREIRAAKQKVLQNRSVLCLFSIKKGISQAKVIFKIIKPSVNNIKKMFAKDSTEFQLLNEV